MLRHQYLVERINNRKPSRKGDYLFAVVLIAWCAYWWIAALVGAHF